MSVIKTSTNTVVKTVTVGSGPVGVAITPNGSDAYVANRGSNTVSVIKTSINTVVKTVTVGTAPDGVAITPNGSDAYVANVGLQHRERHQDLHQHGGEDGGGRQRASRGRHHPQRERRLRDQPGPNTVSVVKTSTNTVVKTVRVGSGPAAVAITPNGSDAYVANYCPTP